MSLLGGTNNKPATGLFGSTQPTQSSLFGSAPNTNTPASGFGSLLPQQQQQPQQQQVNSFGGAQSQSLQTGGLFGGGGALGSSNSGTSSSIFGNTGTGANTGGTGSSIFGNVGANTGANTGGTGGGLFGNTGTSTGANAGGTGSSIFGNVGANTGANTGGTGGGLFGNTGASAGANPGGTSGGLFGNTGTNTGPSTGATGGGLFGNTGTNTGANTGGTGGGLFGNTGTNAGANIGGTGGGLFGNTGTNAGANTGGTGGGLFGNTSLNTNTGAAAPAGSIFGNTSNTGPGTSSIFGQPSSTANPSPFGQQQPQQQTSSLFGSFANQNQTQNQNQSQPSLGAFNLGQSSANTSGGASGLFSSTSQAQNPLGASTSIPPLSQSSLGSSLFGPKPSPFTTSSFSPGNQTQQSSDNGAQAQAVALQQRIEAVVAAWNPQSPQCRFQHYFYNLVDPRQVAMYGRPANATNDALWQQAVRENPDPSCMVPALAIGFDDLQKRVEAQDKQAALHQEKLKELQGRLSALSQTHLLSNILRLTRALQTHTLIKHRLLRLIEHIHLLIPSLRSAAISPEEEALRAKLERLKDEVQRGLGGGGGRGRINELWALLGAVKAAKEREAGGRRDGVEWKVIDQEGLERLATILAEQQQGLAYLTSIINNDMKDLEIMEGRGSSGDGNIPYRPASSAASPGSTSTSGMPPMR